MAKLNVAVIFGGYSSEHQVSINSAINVINNLSKEKYNIIPVYINQKGNWFLYEGSIDSIKTVPWEKFGTPCQISTNMDNKGLLRISGDRLKRVPVDVVFPVLHGKFGEDGMMQGLLEMGGLKYVGCGVIASALAMDKATTKTIVSALGVKQAKYLVFRKAELEDRTEVLKQVRYKLGYPCFVKPSRTGSSVGITKVKNKKELDTAIDLALEHDEKIVIEQAIAGREIECAVLGTGGADTVASPIGEILSGAEFYDFDAKYNNAESQTVINPDIGDEAAEKIKKIAVEVFKAIDGSGLSRVDFFIEEKTGNIIFNEINTIPGFTDISMYPMLIEAMGMSQTKLMDRLIEIAMDRQ